MSILSKFKTDFGSRKSNNSNVISMFFILNIVNA